MKIAAPWHSNAPHAPTGYGTQTKQVVSRMNADGHRIMVAANYGVEATVTEFEGIPTYPRGFDVWNNDVVGPYFDDWSAQHPGYRHMQFTLFDCWVFNSPRFDDIPTVSWVPIDHFPTPAQVADFCRKPTVTPVAMSKFGRKALESAGIACEYIPHALEKVYRPTGRVKVGDRMMTGRELMGISDDRWVVGCVNANKAGGGVHRKAWAENILAFSIFARDHDDAVLYLHTERFGAMGGWKLDDLIKSVGLKEHQVKFVNQYAFRMGIPAEGVAAIYTGLDVLLSPTYGEGFGLTLLEAGACGTRAIANNFSAQPELLGDGWLTEGQPFWDPGMKAWFNIPNVGSIVDALESAYQAGRGRSQKAEKFVRDNYDADQVFDTMWRPLLDRLANPPEPAVDALPTTWTNGVTTQPNLTIYIPTYRRPELADLLASLEPQLVPEVEVIIADNDGSAEPLAKALRSPGRVTYIKHPRDIGGDANIVRAFTSGAAPWLWVIGDDDTVTPDALKWVLSEIHEDHDRLILLSVASPKGAAGASGSLAHIASRDAALPLAATLISANVLRRAACDHGRAEDMVASKYGHAYGWPSTRVYVIPEPCLQRVGYEHAGQGIPAGWNGTEIKSAYLTSVGVDPGPAMAGWNYMSAQAQMEMQ